MHPKLQHYMEMSNHFIPNMHWIGDRRLGGHQSWPEKQWGGKKNSSCQELNPSL
jgi:hypothetical protein